MSRQAAPYSSRAFCGTDRALQRGWSRWNKGRRKNSCILFKPCALISVPEPKGKIVLGGVAWEGRGGNLSGRQQGKGIGLECWRRGGGRDLGMKYAVRIHLLRVALEVLCQFQRDALHLLSPRTGSTCCPQGWAALIFSLQPALGWHRLLGAAGLSPGPGRPLWPHRLRGGGDRWGLKVAEGHRHLVQPTGDRCSGLVCSPTPECGHKIIE